MTKYVTKVEIRLKPSARPVVTVTTRSSVGELTRVTQSVDDKTNIQDLVISQVNDAKRLTQVMAEVSRLETGVPASMDLEQYTDNEVDQ